MSLFLPIPQYTTGQYSAQLLDQSNAPVPATTLSSATLTFKDAQTGAVINSRNGQNVLNVNNVTIDSGGHLIWTLQAADNPVFNLALGEETHIATFDVRWPTGRITHAVRITVTNLGLTS